jgi:D-beta-D-heptose 7-phosphate kinase/D-beta-D-heptose 1-phosphate adenosyltransferase
MDYEHFEKLLACFDEKRVMVVGDIYLDEYVTGVMTGISLEAPIPVMEVRERRYNPGAAGNAACNVAALGGQTYMVGVVGDDANGQIVRKEFSVRNVDTTYVVTATDRPTNTYGKLRAGGHNIPLQEVLRTDTPKPTFIAGQVEADVIANIRTLAAQVDAIVVVDQVSAVVTENVIAAIRACAEQYKLLTVADSRARAGSFPEFDVIVPNDREAGIGAGIDVVDDASLIAAGKKLVTVSKNALITRGPKGVSIFERSGAVTDIPIQTAVHVVDVTGAGDTVTAAVSLTLLAGGSFSDAASVGNAAAGVACSKPGVVTVTREETLRALSGVSKPQKLKTLDELKVIMEKLREDGKRVVWTNGCFDILHVGHITYLLRTAQLGDVLIVGLNSDESVRENKGESRPIVNETDRAMVLSSLECVGYVTIFSDKTPMPLLEALKPTVYVKGGDYTVDTIVQEERHLVESYGGEIAIVPGIAGQSTTAIIERILAAESGK